MRLWSDLCCGNINSEIMETRKEAISTLKVCRFCLSPNEPLTSLYEKCKAPKNSVTFSMKVLSCLAIEVFPSDKMPQFICNRCKLFMELSFSFKQICRQADSLILQFIQKGTPFEAITWPSMLNKVYKAHSKSEFGMVKTVIQDGSTVKVMAEEISDSEEDDTDNVYSVQTKEGKSIKVITSINNEENAKEGRKGNKEVKYQAESDDGEIGGGEHKLIREGCWPCDECECTYPLEQLLTLHKHQKHRQRTVQCDECDAKFFSRSDLGTHQLRHSSDMPFQCVACDKKFKRLVLLKRHEKVVHSDLAQLQCPKCPSTYLTQIELDAHYTKHVNVVQPFPCQFCKKSFSDHSGLQKHIVSIHTKKLDFCCNYCPEQFSNVTKLAKHLRTHAGVRAYPCKHCDKSFLKSHHYTRHLRMKHREVIRTPTSSYTETDAYRCEECEETFSTQDEIIYHSALHATRNLTCPLCQEKFDDRDTVTAHIKSHNAGAEFNCSFCELIFTTQEKLDGHTIHAHENENELDYKDTDDEEDDSMDTELFEDEGSINVKDKGDHMVVEIKKAGDYILADSAEMEEEERQDQSEGSEFEINYSEATGPVIATKPSKSATPVKSDARTLTKSSPGGNTNSDFQVNAPMTVATLIATSTSSSVKPQNDESPNILKKAEEIKKQAVLRQSPGSNNSEKKEKAVVKVENSGSAPGASDLSLRLLEKELQDLKRTSRNDVPKTPAKAVDVLKSKRAQIHTSTPKPKPLEKKEVSSLKPAQEKNTQELAMRKLGRQAKENKEMKVTIIKEEKETKDKVNVTLKEEKENAKEVKEKDTPKVVKNGSTDKPIEEQVRRSTRPSKVKDYAKMISAESEEESTDAELEEGDTEKSTSIENPRRGRKPLNKQTPAPPPKPSPAATPSSGPRKRGRPRKEQPPVAPKVSKKEDTDEESGSEAIEDIKPNNEIEPKPSDESITEAKTQPQDPEANVIMSPSGQTLKKVPIKALPPGIKPLPLPRNMTSGEVCEMQIGKKVVKVQKIVMTKAEVEAMTKKGLVEMKDGTIVLKQGIKLPGTGAVSLKSALVGEGEKNKESPKQEVKKLPTRCELGE